MLPTYCSQRNCSVPPSRTAIHLQFVFYGTGLPLDTEERESLTEPFAVLQYTCCLYRCSPSTSATALPRHTIAVTPVALLSVAHTLSQQIPASLEVLQGCRATLQPSQKRPCRSCLATPLSVSQGDFLAKTDRATWGCSSYTHTNRATLCHKVPAPRWLHSKFLTDWRMSLWVQCLQN